MRNNAQAYYLPQKKTPFVAFFYNTRANAQQMLPVPRGVFTWGHSAMPPSLGWPG